MKKQYIVPSLTVMEFDRMDVIATSSIPYGGSNGNGGPTDAGAPRRNAIWDEEW